MADLGGGVEETSFMDLKDDNFIQIFTYLDLPSLLRLRVNKRLDALVLSVNSTVKDVVLDANPDGYQLKVVTSTCTYRHQSRDLNQLEQGIRRLALNGPIDRVINWWNLIPTEQHSGLIDAMFQFKADSIFMSAPSIRPFQKCSLPQVNLASILTLAEHFAYVHITFICTSLSGQDLSILRKMMLEGRCKANDFKVNVDKRSYMSFVEDCFGVTIDEVDEPYLQTREYHAADESVELYLEEPSSKFHDNLCHFESGLMTHMDYFTLISSYQILFQKRSRNIWSWHRKIEWNNLYSETPLRDILGL